MFASTISGTVVSPVRLALRLWQATGREIQVEAQGASMTPLIRAGDQVSLRLLEAGKLKPGDILAFWQGDNLVVHRCLTKKKVNGAWWFCQKGDNASAWSWVPEDGVLGQVAMIRRGGRTLNLGRWPWTWINPWVSLAAAFLIRVAAGSGARTLSPPGHRFSAALISSGHKIFQLFIIACHVAACHRQGRAKVNRMQNFERDGL